MALIGYARVSTDEQTTDPQIDALKAAGCQTILREHGSGGDRARPELKRALERCGRGDVLVVVRIDRLARSLSHLLEIIETLDARGAGFRSLGDPIDTTSPQGRFTLQILGAVAEFERALIRERTRAGLKAARERGRIGGNPGLRLRSETVIRAVHGAREDRPGAGPRGAPAGARRLCRSGRAGADAAAARQRRSGHPGRHGGPDAGDPDAGQHRPSPRTPALPHAPRRDPLVDLVGAEPAGAGGGSRAAAGPSLPVPNGATPAWPSAEIAQTRGGGKLTRGTSA
jgi:DNA invertase Pin-like site-specific DNA recombinase